MKKRYSKPIWELVDYTSSTVITLNLASKTQGVINFDDNKGEEVEWDSFFN